MNVGWLPRPVPLPASGVAAIGDVARRLAERVLEGPLDGLSGVAGPGVLVLLGERDSLPWVDGVVYIGREAAVWMPVHLAPDLDASWLAAALGEEGLVWQERFVPLGKARPLDAEALQRWLA